MATSTLVGRLRPYLAALALVLLALPAVLWARSAAAQFAFEEKATLGIQLDRSAYAPGQGARLAVMMTLEEGWHSNSHLPKQEYLIPTLAELDLPAGWPEASWEYPEGQMMRFEFEDDPVSVYDGTVPLLARLEIPADAAPGAVSVEARISYQACDDKQCLPPVTTAVTAEILVGPDGAPNPAFLADPGSATAGGDGGTSLAWMLLLGVVGGLILNVMPCVLPVLSLKVFSLVKAAAQGRQETVKGSLAAAAGILVSFWGLALAAVLARSAGRAVGWGVQFQEPAFVTALAVIVVLFCLNLWGLFEIQLPAFLRNRLATGGGTAEGNSGSLGGHFASGLFATLMATPCTAPFLGTALGFALAQPAGTVFAVFTAVGVGMALPYFVLAAAPGAVKVFPKPGLWMETAKGVMGFLLAAAALWLFYVLALQVDPARLALIQGALLALALFLWLRHRWHGAGSVRPALAGIGTLAAAVLAVYLAVTAPAASATPGTPESGLIAWQPFDRAEAESLAAAGEKVFVDVTAAWCFTCKVNERTVLETNEVASAFERHGIIPMKADWTRPDKEISRLLSDYDRSGIPFYLLYRPGAPPFVFSELLTKDAVLSALEDSVPRGVVSEEASVARGTG